MAITVVLALVLSLVLALAGPVSAPPPPGWNVSGPWTLNFYVGGNPVSTWGVTFGQSGGTLSGNGSYSTYTWVISGSVSGSTINFTGDYGATYSGTITVGGTITAGGMSGTWSQDGSQSGSGTWTTTSGQATPMPNIGNAVITGNVVAPTITVTPPPPIDFGLLKLGPNAKASAPDGGLTIDLGSANIVGWQITAQDMSSNQGHLAQNPSVYLADELMIGKDTSSLWYNANGSGGVLTYTGGYDGSTWTGDALSFAAGQTVLATDPAGNGFYTTITFTATITTEN